MSYEGVGFVSVESTEDLNLYFQVALYADGRIEMHWGQGPPRRHKHIVAGLKGFNIAVPASERPFGAGGVTGLGA